MGRGSQEAEEQLGQALNGRPVELVTLGRLSSEEVSQNLTRSDVAVFVRGGVSSRRGGAIAAIACGVPLVAYSGPETGPPLTEAGVLLVPTGDREELARAAIRVLTDDRLWQELHQRSLRAQQEYFSWSAIAERFDSVLSL
jgi:glycosyltransferase involved in cell wall biosynthesis